MMSPASGLGGLRIAHLIESDGPGGAERVVAGLATTLAGGRRRQRRVPARRRRRLAGATSSTARASRSSTSRSIVPCRRTCARGLVQAFRRHRIAVAHSHEFSMAVYGAWASWRAGVPHVITMHGSRYYAGATPAAAGHAGGDRGERPNSGRVGSARASDLPTTSACRRSRVAVLPNGVRHHEPSASRCATSCGSRRTIALIVAVGNLYPVKGHVHAIDALALLAARHPSVHLAISGRGELEGALLARARDHGLERRVHLLGLRSDVPAVLAAADVVRAAVAVGGTAARAARGDVRRPPDRRDRCRRGARGARRRRRRHARRAGKSGRARGRARPPAVESSGGAPPRRPRGPCMRRRNTTCRAWSNDMPACTRRRCAAATCQIDDATVLSLR